MSDIIDFKKIRLETFLIKFAKSNEIPNEFIDGTINVDIMYNTYKDDISEYHLKLLNSFSTSGPSATENPISAKIHVSSSITWDTG